MKQLYNNDINIWLWNSSRLASCGLFAPMLIHKVRCEAVYIMTTVTTQVALPGVKAIVQPHVDKIHSTVKKHDVTVITVPGTLGDHGRLSCAGTGGNVVGRTSRALISAFFSTGAIRLTWACFRNVGKWHGRLILNKAHRAGFCHHLGRHTPRIIQRILGLGQRWMVALQNCSSLWFSRDD